MDTYRGRPVFPFFINRATPWTGSLEYDAQVKQYGGGAAVATGLLQHRCKRLELDARAESLADIEEFFLTARGQANGFWLPLVQYVAVVVAGVDTQDFLVSGTALAARWGQDPTQYIMLTDGAGNAYLRHVASATVSGTSSLVALDTAEDALPAVPAAGWKVSLLLYVRLASDDLEDIQRLNYGTFSFSLTVIELPFEYDTAATPSEVLYLYAFGYSLGTVENFEYFTNWGVSVTGTDGLNFAPEAIQHGDIEEDSEGRTCDIECLRWDGCPLDEMFPYTDGRLPLRVKIWRSHWDWDELAETGTRYLLFDGVVRQPHGKGNYYSASCQSGAELYSRSIPTKPLSRTCRACFCDDTCGLDRETYSTPATVVSVTETTRYYIVVETAAALTTDYVLYGLVGTEDYYAGQPTKYWEYQAVQAMTDLGSNQYRLQLRMTFKHLAVGDTCRLMRGCAKTSAACTDFGNVAAFDGEPLTPLRNPQTTTAATTSSGKK